MFISEVNLIASLITIINDFMISFVVDSWYCKHNFEGDMLYIGFKLDLQET